MVIALLCLFAISAEAQPLTWVGYAASTDGRAYRIVGGNEYTAREDARAHCEQMTLRSCNAMSVHENSFVYIINCVYAGNSQSFMGGSNINMGAAQWLANDKAQRANYVPATDCREIFRF